MIFENCWKSQRNQKSPSKRLEEHSVSIVVVIAIYPKTHTDVPDLQLTILRLWKGDSKLKSSKMNCSVQYPFDFPREWRQTWVPSIFLSLSFPLSSPPCAHATDLPFSDFSQQYKETGNIPVTWFAHQIATLNEIHELPFICSKRATVAAAATFEWHLTSETNNDP